jgi:anti-sigma28 factor (negative regulator of flagellin synthesis)
MKIGPVPPNRPAQTSETTPMRSKQAQKSKNQAEDSVELSSSARKLLADAANDARKTLLGKIEPTNGGTAADDLSGAERIARLKQRVQSGYYERPEVKRQIADTLADDIKP